MARRRSRARGGFTIPHYFTLAGHTIEVRVLDDTDWPHSRKAIGVWDAQNLRIDVLLCAEPSITEQVFLHEVLHAILSVLSQDKLNRREPLINSMSHLLRQALTSGVGSHKI